MFACVIHTSCIVVDILSACGLHVSCIMFTCSVLINMISYGTSFVVCAFKLLSVRLCSVPVTSLPCGVDNEMT